ncbi:unnamed protein product [Calypogeia fissa]
MYIHVRQVVLLSLVSWLSLTSAHSFDSSSYPPEDVITRDICIIGGGSSGTFAAVQLHDTGKSVVVVERNDRLGGHTETYIDPATKTPVDLGVVDFNNIDAVKNYFARLNVSYFVANNSGSSASSPTYYADFSTGDVFPNFVPPDPTAALRLYAAQLANYPYLTAGFDLPSPIPEDLLLPFGQWVTKYGLQDAVFVIFSYAGGIGNLLEQPTLYVIKLIGLDLLNTLQIGFINTVSNDNSEIYTKAFNVLGESNVLLCSHVIATNRGSDAEYVKVLVQTSNNVTKLIQAKKLVISIPPKLDNLVGFDLSEEEIGLFCQFRSAAYYTALLTNTGINSTFSVLNVNLNKPYDLPILPAPYNFLPSPVPSLTHLYYGSDDLLAEEQVKEDIIKSVLLLQKNLTTGTSMAPSFVVFSTHAPFEMTVPTSAIAKGFYKDLYGLQGQRRTYYTGAAFHTQDSALLWRFTEALSTIVA